MRARNTTAVDEAEEKYIQEKFDQMRKTGRIGSLLTGSGTQYTAPAEAAKGDGESGAGTKQVAAISSSAATPKYSSTGRRMSSKSAREGKERLTGSAARKRSGSASKRIVINAEGFGKSAATGPDRVRGTPGDHSVADSASSKKPPLLQKQRLTANDSMSKQEMLQIIESQSKEIKHLQEKVRGLESQKEQMVDNFKLSSSVLLERLKDLEQYKQQAEQLAHLAQMSGTARGAFVPTERPQTANVLSEITSGQLGEGRIGPNPSTAASSNQQDQLYSSRGFGELGSTKRDKGQSVKLQLVKTQAQQKDEEKSSSEEDEQPDGPDQSPNDRVQCPNCAQFMLFKELAAHTVQCYRNSTKCKVCGEIINKDKKKEHLMRWRDEGMLKAAIIEDREEQVSQHFDHGMDCNMQFATEKEKSSVSPLNATMRSLSKIPIPDAKNQNRDNWTPMHYAAENGSLNVILAMVSRGAGIDPTDEFLRTPLMIAIENNKSAVARSLIELGADIENTDIYGKTPLMYACKIASKEIVELLIKCKADIKSVNKVGDSAVTMAQKSGNQEIMMLLVKSGASIRPASRSRPLAK